MSMRFLYSQDISVCDTFFTFSIKSLVNLIRVWPNPKTAHICMEIKMENQRDDQKMEAHVRAGMYRLGVSASEITKLVRWKDDETISKLHSEIQSLHTLLYFDKIKSEQNMSSTFRYCTRKFHWCAVFLRRGHNTQIYCVQCCGYS